MGQIQYVFQIEEAKHDLLIAMLSEFPFYAFESAGDQLFAYIHEKDWSEELGQSIQDLDWLKPHPFTTKKLPYQNWNEVWESNFQPIKVNDFCYIRAPFHEEDKSAQYQILINPEMAFGTGHHATTFMMIQLMADVDFLEKKVLDYGCGTGILAILADMLGASTIDAIDIEQPAYENTLANASINAATKVNALHGTLPDIYATDYQIVLANINRNVILSSLPALNTHLLQDGFLFLSGVLQKDFPLVKQRAEDEGFSYRTHLIKGDWVALLMQKT